MKKIHLIKQHDEKDCGAACLSMILEYYGKKLPIASIREAIQVDQYGANIYGMIDGAKKNGLIASGLEGTVEEMITGINDNTIQLPIIIRIVNREFYEHYVIISKFANSKFTIYDPDIGKRKLSVKELNECFLGQVITFEKDTCFKSENKRVSNISRFVKMIMRQKLLLLIVALISLAIIAIGLSGTFLFRFLIDNVLSNLSDITAINENLDIFAVLITALAGLYVLKLIVQMLRGKLLTMMSKNIDLSLMLGYFDHLTELPMRFFDTRKTGEIMSRFNDAGKIRDAISGAALTLMIDTTMVVTCGILLYQISPNLFIIAIITFFIYMLIAAIYVKPIEKVNRQMMEEDAQFNSYIKESIDGMETVKTSKAENIIKNKTVSLFNKFLNENIKGSLISLSKDALIEFFTSFSSLIILWIGAIQVIDGSISLGQLITFTTLLSYFLDPVQNLVNLQNNLQTAIVAADRLSDIMDLSAERNGTLIPDTPLSQIAFDTVTFRYGNRPLVLDGLSFKAGKGQQIALVGESGCGKSTIAKLLQGLYFPETGSVSINNISSEKLSLSWLRGQIAFVPQNTFLFSDTVRNNLTLGIQADQIPSDEEIYQILDMCCCQFIKELPFGLDSLLEENGANLSGGQRQRLSIARALLRNPKLLILDEATSALDTITENKIQNAIRLNYPDIIIVMIAHRLSTIRHCDTIIVLDKGNLIEQGTHTELLHLGNRYAQLWSKQNIQLDFEN